VKQTTRQQPLLGSGPRTEMEVLLEAVFSVCSASEVIHLDWPSSLQFSECSAVELSELERVGW
jgi:hypothetical protein